MSLKIHSFKNNKSISIGENLEKINFENFK